MLFLHIYVNLNEGTARIVDDDNGIAVSQMFDNVSAITSKIFSSGFWVNF